MPQGLQHPGASQQQLLKAHTEARHKGRIWPVEAAQDGMGKGRSREQSVSL